MKKRLSILSFLAILVFALFSFSTGALAIKKDTSFEDGRIISASDTLYEPEPVPGFDSEKSYTDGEIIYESDTLYEPEQTNAVIDNTNEKNAPYDFYIYKDKTIVAPYSSFSSIPETRYYEEYTDGYWYRGTLKLKSVVASGSGWSATYSGTLSAWVE
ncbi:hypothetical protein [Lysinibacillus cavernae]|uniref:hypothetical protein n=1 Tax=Lysinibacillus cavernae TaxID=2666135 RepID=UPI0012D99447|nr:hypothetical protein [Lysinibacillus cavernae]